MRSAVADADVSLRGSLRDLHLDLVLGDDGSTPDEFDGSLPNKTETRP